MDSYYDSHMFGFRNYEKFRDKRDTFCTYDSAQHFLNVSGCMLWIATYTLKTPYAPFVFKQVLDGGDVKHLWHWMSAALLILLSSHNPPKTACTTCRWIFSWLRVASTKALFNISISFFFKIPLFDHRSLLNNHSSTWS